MLDKPLRDDPGHDLAGVANLLSAAVVQREGECSGVAGFRSGSMPQDRSGGWTKQERVA